MELPCKLPVRSSHLVPSSRHAAKTGQRHLIHVETPPSGRHAPSRALSLRPHWPTPTRAPRGARAELMRVQGSRPRAEAPFLSFPARSTPLESRSVSSGVPPPGSPCLGLCHPQSLACGGRGCLFRWLCRSLLSVGGCWANLCRVECERCRLPMHGGRCTTRRGAFYYPRRLVISSCIQEKMRPVSLRMQVHLSSSRLLELQEAPVGPPGSPQMGACSPAPRNKGSLKRAPRGR